MKVMNDFWPAILLIINVVQALVLYSFRAALRIAILELKETLADKYATKDDLEKVMDEIDLRVAVDRGFAEVKQLVRPATGRSS